MVGALLMDIKPAFNIFSRSHMCQRMATLEVDSDLVWWTDLRQTHPAGDGRTNGGRTQHLSGIGSPASPVLFAVYISEMFGYVEERWTSAHCHSSMT